MNDPFDMSSLREQLSSLDTAFFSALTKGPDALLAFESQYASLVDVLTQRPVGASVLPYNKVFGLQMVAEAVRDMELFTIGTFSRLVADIDSKPMEALFGDAAYSRSGASCPTYIAHAYRWLLDNIHNPYPCKDEKQAIANASDCDYRQVHLWFSRARSRIGWNKLRKEVFEGRLADMVAAATQVFHGSKSGSTRAPVPQDQQNQFFAIREAAYDLYAHLFNESDTLRVMVSNLRLQTPEARTELSRHGSEMSGVRTRRQRKDPGLQIRELPDQRQNCKRKRGAVGDLFDPGSDVDERPGSGKRTRHAYPTPATTPEPLSRDVSLSPLLDSPVALPHPRKAHVITRVRSTMSENSDACQAPAYPLVAPEVLGHRQSITPPAIIGDLSPDPNRRSTLPSHVNLPDVQVSDEECNLHMSEFGLPAVGVAFRAPGPVREDAEDRRNGEVAQVAFCRTDYTAGVDSPASEPPSAMSSGLTGSSPTKADDLLLDLSSMMTNGIECAPRKRRYGELAPEKRRAVHRPCMVAADIPAGRDQITSVDGDIGSPPTKRRRTLVSSANISSFSGSEDDVMSSSTLAPGCCVQSRIRMRSAKRCTRTRVAGSRLRTGVESPDDPKALLAALQAVEHINGLVSNGGEEDEQREEQATKVEQLTDEDRLGAAPELLPPLHIESFDCSLLSSFTHSRVSSHSEAPRITSATHQAVATPVSVQARFPPLDTSPSCYLEMSTNENYSPCSSGTISPITPADDIQAWGFGETNAYLGMEPGENTLTFDVGVDALADLDLTYLLDDKAFECGSLSSFDLDLPVPLDSNMSYDTFLKNFDGSQPPRVAAPENGLLGPTVAAQ
ncbi:hypothetical protein FISHEDRAFT_70933 [Fistulina hepatica ATCC 64428]|uniref:KN homeodomain domain-containing protein n=1 Tax=Fistulina hepatica ATCC 64428 TaxID=1128425 RepID=A0A0D7AHF4_9AGAR|nr:hypothetical protein FISHEDRAFT_70933 [Fistulina hepatica ATCC 64428]